jgi:hypothetical protein
MLGTGARYAEYGITGGFFLLMQALILGLAYANVSDVLVTGANRMGVLLTENVGKIPEVVRPAIQSLLVALALLSVFIIGLVLEILGSVFMVSEASLFRKRLAMNQWVAKFVEAELPDYAEDYRLLLDLANPWSAWRWNAIRRGPSRNFKRLRQLQQRFRRVESVLIAKVLASGAKTELLVEQISICRMSRAIGTTLYVASIEFYLGSEGSGAIFIAIGGSVFSLVCGTLITLGAYSRFASMLLSLVYATWKPQTAALAESRGERGET